MSKKEEIKDVEIVEEKQEVKEEPKQEKKSSGVGIVVVILLFIVMIIGALLIALNNVGLLKIDGLKNINKKRKVELQYTETTKTKSEGVYITDVSDVVEEVMPSIVSITSKTLVKSGMFGPSYYYGRGQEQGCP